MIKIPKDAWGEPLVYETPDGFQRNDKCWLWAIPEGNFEQYLQLYHPEFKQCLERKSA